MNTKTYFLIQIKAKEDSTPKSITLYETEAEAKAAFHDTCGQCYKDNTLIGFTVSLINQFGGNEEEAVSTMPPITE